MNQPQCVEECGVCKDALVPHPNQPFGITVQTEDGVTLMQMHIPKTGTYVPQHAHSYAHLSMLVKGKVSAWAGGNYLGDFEAPHAFHIGARVKHTFLSLEDGTELWCVHNTSRSGEIEIHEEHHLVGSDQCRGP